MRIPKFLAPNDTIGFIAPSYGCASGVYKLCFENALSRFTGMGYQTVTGPNCTLAEGYGKSNTPSKCGDEINDFFLNRDCKIIMSAGGGETMCEDLNFVDFEAISKAEPKWFTGYSDNTNLTFLLPVLADTAALYASCAQSYGMGEWHPYIDTLYECIGKLQDDLKTLYKFINLCKDTSECECDDFEKSMQDLSAININSEK